MTWCAYCQFDGNNRSHNAHIELMKQEAEKEREKENESNDPGGPKPTTS